MSRVLLPFALALCSCVSAGPLALGLRDLSPGVSADNSAIVVLDKVRLTKLDGKTAPKLGDVFSNPPEMAVKVPPGPHEFVFVSTVGSSSVFSERIDASPGRVYRLSITVGRLVKSDRNSLTYAAHARMEDITGSLVVDAEF